MVGTERVLHLDLARTCLAFGLGLGGIRGNPSAGLGPMLSVVIHRDRRGSSASGERMQLALCSVGLRVDGGNVNDLWGRGEAS